LLDIPKIASGIKSQVPYQSAFKFSGKQFNVASKLFSFGIGLSNNSEPMVEQKHDKTSNNSSPDKLKNHIENFQKGFFSRLLSGIIGGLTVYVGLKLQKRID
jgi:hypothetical protein